MKTYWRSIQFIIYILVALFCSPATADASLFKLWVEGRGDLIGGSSDLFSEYDSPVGGGLELGLELLEITLFGEFVAFGTDQFLLTLNFGVDVDFGEKEQPRFTIGFYTGPMFLQLPKDELSNDIDLSQLTEDEQQQLICATVCSCAPSVPCNKNIGDVEEHFSTYSQQEERIDSLAAGWNIIRLRLSLDYPIVSFLYIGLAAHAGYHFIISGEEVVSGARDQVIESYSSNYDIDPLLEEKLRRVANAKPIDKTKLDGFNYGIHIYLRFEINP